MASFSVVKEGYDMQMNVEARSFSSFLTEDMLDAAMNNIQNLRDTDDEDGMFVDDETSGISSNGDCSLEADIILEEHMNKDQHWSKKTDVIDLNASCKLVQNEIVPIENLKGDPIVSENVCLDTTSAMEIHSKETNKLRFEIIVEEEATNDIEYREKAKNIEEKLLTIGDAVNMDENTSTYKNATKDVNNQLIGTDKNTNVELTVVKDINVSNNEINTKMALTKDSDGQDICKGNVINSNTEILNKANYMKMTVERRCEKDIALIEVDRQSKIPEVGTTTLTKEADYSNLEVDTNPLTKESDYSNPEVDTTPLTKKADYSNPEVDTIPLTKEADNSNQEVDTNPLTKEADNSNQEVDAIPLTKEAYYSNPEVDTTPLTKRAGYSNNTLDGTNDQIIISIKEAFSKIKTMREKRIIDNILTVETENHVDAASVTEYAANENIMTSTNEQNRLVKVDAEKNLRVTEKTQLNLVHNNSVENSSEPNKSFDEIMMDYEEISDDDEEVLEIDDNLEKEIENNLIAEIGLSPQSKKTCFVLDDPEVVDYVEDVEVIEKEEAQKSAESITLYSADASSMVECVLDSNEVSSPPSASDLIPNTSYLEGCTTIQTPSESNESKQIKVIYMKENKQPEVVKQLIPVLKNSTSLNKNVQYLLKVNGNVAMDSLVSKKLKLVPVQKSLLQKKGPTSNNIVIKDPSFQEMVLKKQIIESQLPPYSSSVLATSTVFRCEECKDTFLVQSSLKHHINRRSVIITYWCRICCFSIQFYNRCLMLKHIRSHRQYVANIDPTSVEVKPISKEMLELGLPNCITQDWEDNSVKKTFSNYSITNYQTGKNASVLSKPKTLTSVIKIPRTNANQFVPLSSLSMTNTTSNKDVHLINEEKNTQSESVQVSNQEKLLDTQCVQNNNKKTSFGTIDVELNTIENHKNSESHFDSETSFYPQSAEIPSEIRIHEVYSMNVPETITADEQDISSVVEETVNEFKSLLGEKTEEKIPRISVKALPLVENDLLTDCKIISMLNKNGIINNKKTYTQDKGRGAKLKSKTDLSEYVYCSECGIKVLEMERHLSKTNQPTDHNLTCRVCRLILPTKCSLKIHLRVHMKLPPYKCPECGKQFNVFEKLFSHIRYVCGHLSRLVKYICSKCRKPCSNLVQLESHIFTSHTNRVFKCSKCPVAFFNISSVKKHKSKEHPGLDIFPLTYQQCTLCPDLIPRGKVSEHISKHARNPNQLAYVYHCPGCKKWYTNNKAGFVFHLKNCEKVSNELKKYNNEVTAVCNKSKSEDVNSGDSDCFTEENSIESKSPQLDDEDVIEMSEKDPLSLEDWEAKVEHHVIEKRIEMCIVCKVEPVIILPGTDLNKQSLCCKLCVKPVDIESLQNKSSSYKFKEKTNLKPKTGKLTHQQAKSKLSNEIILNRKRSSRPIKRKINLDFEYDTVDYSFINQNSEKSDSTCSSPENKKLPKNKIKFKKSKVDSSPDESGINFVRGQVIPENQSSDVFCTKCGFKADNVAEFRNHVVTHRTDPNAYQCLECGLCFVVRPSLEKHLIVLHRIKNVEEYIQNNDVGGGHVVKVEQEEETDSRNDEVQENQCRVCYLMCDSSTSLDKHFRTHGMAFLMSSQRQVKKL